MSFVFSEKPIELTAGAGVHLYDTNDTAYLDLGASYGCMPVGHSHPTVVDAIATQTATLQFAHASYPTAIRDTLIERLCDLSPIDHTNCWLANSGTEANEAALKFARSATGATKIIAAHRGFHGRTMGSLSVTWKPKYRVPFEPMLEDVEFVPFGDGEALEAAVDDDVAAVILEPIQGEGGVRQPEGSYLSLARKVTAEHGAALILDEIQTGLGRTGTFWACASADIEPDIITSAKGLASGLPIGATLCADWIAAGVQSHGSTFGGNPVVAAAACATLETIMTEGLTAHAAHIGKALRSRVEAEVAAVTDVRGKGLLIGIDTEHPATEVLQQLALEHHILAMAAGRQTIRLLPPLTLEDEHVEQFVTGLDATLTATEVVR